MRQELLKRQAQPDASANRTHVALFLASDLSAAVTGESILVEEDMSNTQ